MRALAVTALLGVLGCKREAPSHDRPLEPPPRAKSQDKPDPERDEFIADVAAFTGDTREAILERMGQGAAPLAAEWTAWEAAGPMTDDRIRAFYKETRSYIYELGAWHLDDPLKRQSDEWLVADLVKRQPKNVLDFGGGTGHLALPLARAGLDVTLADLDSTSLAFAVSRAKRHDIRLKVWKTDVEENAPDAKYDIILALDVLEHLPADELTRAVDRLVKLKHARTLVVLSAPFGRTATHPMHLDADAHTKQQVTRLQGEYAP